MTDLLLDVPASEPRWKELQRKHGIFSHHSETVDEEVAWSAWDFSTLSEETRKDREPLDLIAEYCVLIEDRGGYSEAPTEREAVIALLHKRQFDGWKEVSL